MNKKDIPSWDDTEEVAPSWDDTQDVSEDIFSLKEEIDPNDPSQLEASGRGAVQGATLGMADELGAAALAPIEMLRQKISELIPGSMENVDEQLRKQGFKGLDENELTDIYKNLRDTTRESNKAAQEANPWTYGAADVVGGIAPGLLSGGGTAAASILKTGGKEAMKQASKIGAKYGAASGYGYGEGETIGEDIIDTATGGVVGAGLGAALPLAIKGAKIGAGKLKKGAQDLLETIVPESEAIKAGYKYGKQGKKVAQEVIDEDLKSISKKILKNIEADKKANKLKEVKEKLDALGLKVNTKKAVDEAIEDLRKLTKGDVLDLQNKDLLPKLRKLTGHDIQGEKMAAQAQKQAIKKQLESEGLVDQAIIKGEKNLAKEQIKTGDSLDTITDINRSMDSLDMPLQTKEGVIAGAKGKFKGPDGEDYVKTAISDATPYQPEISKLVDHLGRPIIKTVDKGSGRISAMVGNIENKMKLDLENMTISEVESLRKQLNLATKLAKAQGAADDPIMQRAQQLAGDLKTLTDDVIEKSGKTELIDKRARFSDIFSAEEMLGLDKRLSARKDINKELMSTKLGGKLGFEQGFKTRQEGELAQNLLGKKVVTPEMRQQLDLIKKLNQISGRESQENISRAGLYKMAVGDVPNLIGRGVRGAGNIIKPVTSPVKNTVELLNTMTSQQVQKLGTKLSSSQNNGSKFLGQKLLDAVSQGGDAQAQAIWSLSQSPAFRALIKREVPNMEDEMMNTIEAISPIASAEAADTPYQPTSDRVSNLIRREGSEEFVYKDQIGHDTIGIGHKITPKEKKSGLINGISYKEGLSQEDIMNILSSDLKSHDEDAVKVMNNFNIDQDVLSEDQLDAIKDMVYQLGYGSSMKFKNTMKYIAEGDYEKAASNAAKSKWNKQTPRRVKDFQDRIIKKKESSMDINSVIQGYADQDIPQPEVTTEAPTAEDIEDVNKHIDRVNQQQSSGDGVPVDQIEGLMGKIDALNLSDMDKSEIEDEAINMSGFSDGARLKELLAKIANLR